MFAIIVTSWLVVIISAPFVVVYLNIIYLKRIVSKWTSNATLTFAMSLGGFGASKVEFWRKRGGFSSEEARLVVKFQNICLLEVAAIWLLIMCMFYETLKLIYA
jgi:hypothetical protein